jgi:hypothetical protein
MWKVIDNFNVFPRSFKPHEFYFIQVIVRGKDHPWKVWANGANNARTVRDYTVYEEKQLVRYEREIKEIADMYWARVYMRPSRRSDKEISWKMVEMLWQFLVWSQHRLSSIYAKAVWQNLGTEKLRIIDVDEETEEKVKLVIDDINVIEPMNTVQYYLETVNWWHIITKPFNKTKFEYTYDIHKNNPTLLYFNEKTE